MPLLQKAYLGSTALFKDLSWFQGDVFDLIEESSAVTVTADATAHTKGAWSQLIASTSANIDTLFVQVTDIGVSNTNTATLLDLAIGASGSEVAFVSNIGVGGAGPVIAATNGIIFVLPIKIPSGSRIAARTQAVIGGDTAIVTIRGYSTGSYNSAPTELDSLGTSTATSAGTGIAAQNTYAQIIASTTQAYRGFVFVGSAGSSTGNVNLDVTVGSGASGSEVEIGDFKFRTNSSEQTNHFPINPLASGASIPSGSRLAVKMNATSGFSSYITTLIGIP
jgi:hypothetical protein